jgi:hypothetical protein
VRLLLLPIPRGLLYLGQLTSALAEPWIVLVAAIVAGIAAGMAAGGMPVNGALVALAGVLLVSALTGLGLLAGSAVNLVVRNRRRGEIFALVIILGLPVVGLLPSLMSDGGARSTRERSAPPQPAVRSGWMVSLERAGRAVLPSDLYSRTVVSVSRPGYRETARGLAGLGAEALLLHAAAFAVFTLVLASPGQIGSGSRRSTGTAFSWRLPGTTPAMSAVALTQFLLALRTARGRSIVLSPLLVFGLFAVTMMRRGSQMDLGFFQIVSGTGLAAFTSFISLASIVPLAMNQFGVDRGGLTRALLAPLDTHTLLVGKAAGNALVAGIPAALCVAIAFVLFPSANIAMWLSVPLSLLATYLLIAPAAAVLSAIFPKAADLNSIGQRGNAHRTAGLLGTLAFVAAGGSCLLLVLLATRVFDRPGLAPVFLLVWCLVAGLASVVGLRAAAAVFDRRRENLGMVS